MQTRLSSEDRKSHPNSVYEPTADKKRTSNWRLVLHVDNQLIGRRSNYLPAFGLAFGLDMSAWCAMRHESVVT